METAGFEDFKKLEIKMAKILEVNDHPDADRLYVVKIDIGGEERQIVAGIKLSYGKEELAGLMVPVITNLKPAVIRGVESQGMLLAAHGASGVSVLTCHRPVEAGSGVK